jgi:UDP-N-acetylmuramate dehydrogenase
MNAGAYGSEVKDILETTTYINKNLEIITINNKDNLFKYRQSRFSENNKDIIISATLKLNESKHQQISEKMEENIKLRNKKQPINFPSAGSSFKRGNDYVTAELIDKCNLKGYNIGDAVVSELHAGFIINKGNATAKDVLELVEIIKKTVYEKFNKKIELEFEVLGED